MKKLKQVVALLLAAAMILGLCAGCGGSETEETSVTPVEEGQETSAQGETEELPDEGPQYGGHLDVHVVTAPNGLDPVKNAMLWKYMWLTCVYEPPLSRDADNNVVPSVCDYELSEDKLTLKLTVREEKTFHDGTKVEIEDVLASIQRCLELGNSTKAYLAPYITDMYVEGEVGIITFSEYNERAWSRLASYQTWMAVMPKEICEKYADGQIVDEIEDAIGTGPYKFRDFDVDKQVTIERYEDYVPCDRGYTGFASPKMAYMDTMTFWYNADYSSSTMAMLAGDYDVSDVIETDYQEMAAAAGLVRDDRGPSSTNWMICLNNNGGENLMCKYPDLRKAFMAAIDMEELMDLITDNACVLGGNLVMGSQYDTDIFESADWFGEPNQEVAEKYLAAARAAGYNDEPIQLVGSSTGFDRAQFTLVGSYLDKAGINYKVTYMETAAAAEFLADPQNDWDLRTFYFTRSFTPTTMPDDITTNWWVSEEKDRLLAELGELELDSEEYIAKWLEFAQFMVDECCLIHVGELNWYWNHSSDLVINDDGYGQYFFNAYWKNPEEHGE